MMNRRYVPGSSVIRSHGYSQATRLLEIEFRSGELYRYRDVPRSVWTKLSSPATSAGEMFNRYVRGRFPFERVAA